MKRVLFWLFAGSAALFVGGAEPPKGTAPAKSTPAVSAAATPAAPARPPVARRLEQFLLLPEPRVMRSSHFAIVGGSKTTVFSPAREVADPPGLEVYSDADFARLGISMDTFEKKAREAAERLLGVFRPQLVSDENGKVRYAVYRGEQHLFACLLVAPSLGRVFEQTFGKEIMVAMPDRNALYVFPADAAVVDEFAGDLESRYETSPWAASDEVFLVKMDGPTIKALGRFSGN